MQVGMNTNVHHQGKTLHIQTEDSGSQHGHVITHLFLAGTIIATKKSEYDLNTAPEYLQKLIRSQHQEVINELQSGVYDKKIMLARPRRTQGAIPLARSVKKNKTVTSESISQPSQAMISDDSSQLNRDVDKPSTGRVNNKTIGGPWALPRLKESLISKPNTHDDEEST